MAAGALGAANLPLAGPLAATGTGPLALATGTGPLAGPLALTTGTGPLAGPLALATGTGPLVGPLALGVGTAPEAVVGAPAGAVAPWPRRDASGGRRRAHEAQ